jgi:hypothetical protein
VSHPFDNANQEWLLQDDRGRALVSEVAHDAPDQSGISAGTVSDVHVVVDVVDRSSEWPLYQLRDVIAST